MQITREGLQCIIQQRALNDSWWPSKPLQVLASLLASFFPWKKRFSGEIPRANAASKLKWILLLLLFTDGFIFQQQQQKIFSQKASLLLLLAATRTSDDCEKTLWIPTHNGPICQLPIRKKEDDWPWDSQPQKPAGNCLQHHFQSCFCVNGLCQLLRSKQHGFG